MEGMGLKFTPVTGRCLLHHLSMFEPMAGTSVTTSKTVVIMQVKITRSKTIQIFYKSSDLLLFSKILEL